MPTEESQPRTPAADGPSYGEHVKPLISTLYQAVVGLGLLAVSIQYIQVAYQDAGVLADSTFWLRWLLLIGVLAFSCYCMLSYQATRFEGPSAPGRLLGMYGLEILHVALCAWMFAALAPLDSPGDGNPFAPVRTSLIIVTALTSIWHISVLAWYVAAPGSITKHRVSSLIHAAFAVGQGLLTLAAASLHGAVAEWFIGTAYVGAVLALFATQGMRSLRGAIVL